MYIYIYTHMYVYIYTYMSIFVFDGQEESVSVYRVVKRHRMPYPYRSLSAKESYN